MNRDASAAAVHLRFPLLLADDFRQLLGANSEVKMPMDLPNSASYPHPVSSMYKGFSSPLDGASLLSSRFSEAGPKGKGEGEHCIFGSDNIVAGNVGVGNPDMAASTPLFSPPTCFSFREEGDKQFPLPPKNLLKAYMIKRAILARAQQPSLSSAPLHETLAASQESQPIFSDNQKIRKNTIRQVWLHQLYRNTDKGFAGLSMSEDHSHRCRKGKSAACDSRWDSSPFHSPSSRSHWLVLQDIERFSNELALLWSSETLWEEETEDGDMTSPEIHRSSTRMTGDDLSRNEEESTSAAKGETASSSLSSSISLGGRHSSRFAEEECRSPSMRKIKEEGDRTMSPRCFLEEMGHYARQLALVMMHTTSEGTACSSFYGQSILPFEVGSHVTGNEKVLSSLESQHFSVASTECKEGHSNHTRCTPMSSFTSASKSSLPINPLTSDAVPIKSHGTVHSTIKNRQSKDDKRTRINVDSDHEEPDKKAEEERTGRVSFARETTTEQDCNAENECDTINRRNGDALHFPCYPLQEEEEEKEKKLKECLAPKEVFLHLIALLQQRFLHFLRSLSPVTLNMEGGSIVEWWLSFPFLCSCWVEWKTPSEKQECKEENNATEDESDEKKAKTSTRRETAASTSAFLPIICYRHRAHLWDLFHFLIATLYRWCAEVPSLCVSSAPLPRLPHPPPSFTSSMDPTESPRHSSPYPFQSAGSNGLPGANPNSTGDPLSSFPTDSSCHPISLVYAIHAVASYYHCNFARSGELANMNEEVETADILFPSTSTTAVTDSSVKAPFSTRSLSSPSLSSPSSSWRMLHELCEAMIHVATVLPLPYLLPLCSDSHGTSEQFFFLHCQPPSRDKERDSMENAAQHDFTARSPLTASCHSVSFRTLFSLVLEIIIQVHQLHMKEGKHDAENSNWKPFSTSSSQAFFSRMFFLQDVYDIQTSCEEGSDHRTTWAALASCVENTSIEKPTKNADLFSLPEFHGIPEAIQRFNSLTGAL